MGQSPLFVDGDPEQLHQVFVNLLLNGIESMKPGGTLEVTVTATPHDRERGRVIVADRGGGIPVEPMDRIFEPFVTTKERGTGLGLAVSRRIVHEHGGSIVAANRPEGGAVFSVELQLVASTNSAGVEATGAQFSALN
jgi:signal transduction histidine kinase